MRGLRRRIRDSAALRKDGPNVDPILRGLRQYLPVNPHYNPNPAQPTDFYGPFAAFRAKYPYDDRTDEELYKRWDEDEDED